MLTQIHNISKLHLGQEIYTKSRQKYVVVGLFTDPRDIHPKEHSGTIYADFEDNEGDVLEFDLSKDKLYNFND